MGAHLTLESCGCLRDRNGERMRTCIEHLDAAGFGEQLTAEARRLIAIALRHYATAIWRSDLTTATRHVRRVWQLPEIDTQGIDPVGGEGDNVVFQHMPLHTQRP